MCRRRSQSPIPGPPNLHVYARYFQNDEDLLVPSTRYSVVKLELDSMRSTHVSTQFETDQALASPFRKTHGGFLTVEQWIKSSSAFRGTLVNGVLLPGVRLGNGLNFRLHSTRNAALEPAAGPKNEVDERDASRSSVGAEWQREYPNIKFNDFASAISVESPLDSSLGLDLRSGFEGLRSIEGGLSLSEEAEDLKEREGELKRLLRTFLWNVEKSPLSNLKLAADELELQKGKLESQLESQLARQEAWDRCEDYASRRANLEERELILKVEVAQLRWMQMNWLWLTKVFKMEESLKRIAEGKQNLKKREKFTKKWLRRRGLEHELERALDEEENSASGEKRRRTDVLRRQATKPTAPSRVRKEAAPLNPEAKSVFEFLSESGTETPDALELLERASRRP